VRKRPHSRAGVFAGRAVAIKDPCDKSGLDKALS
jgi:hypothetical protein